MIPLTMIDVEETWQEMVSSGALRTVYRRVEEVAGVTCALGYTPLTKARFFQLEIPAGINPRLVVPRRTQAITLQRIQSEGTSDAVLLMLNEPSLSDVFTMFISDVVVHLLPTRDPSAALTIVHKRIEHWQALFSRLVGDMLGPAVQRGLYGELLVLRKLIDRYPAQPHIWDCWRGPYSANHDFSISGVAMEIKTSIASSPTMHITNEVQLDPFGWNTLLLCLVHLSEIRGGANTLSALIAELVGRTAELPATRIILRSKLLQVGVPEERYDQYTDVGYELRRPLFYHVREDFPAIRRSTLSNAIGKVSYELEPAGCTAFEIDETTALAHFR